MSIYTRKLFNRGGQVSSRGVGITSGLVDRPVQKFSNGGEATSALQTSMSDKLKVLQDLDLGRPELSSKREILTPALLKFFGSLMSGKSLQGGLGGGLEIAGQALQQSAPDFAAAGSAIRKERADQVNFDNTLKLKAFDLAYDEMIADKKADSKETFSSSKYEVRLKENNPDGKTSVATEFFNKNNPSETYYMIGDNEVEADKFDIIGTLGTAKDDTPKQNYTYQDYKIKLNDDSEVVLTKVTDKTGQEQPKWINAAGADFDSSKIDKVIGTLGTATDDTKPKKRTPTTDTYYAPNPEYKEGDDITTKYLQVAVKIDEDNNISLKDPGTGNYISENAFTEKYGAAVSDQPIDWKPRLEQEIKEEVADAQKEKMFTIFKDQFSKLDANLDKDFELTEADLDYLYAAFPNEADFVKTTPAGKVNELRGELFDIYLQKQSVNKAEIESSTSTNHPDGTVKDAVDVYYNLRNDDPDYDRKKVYYQQKYNALPVMSEETAKDINEALNNLKDLNVILDNVDEAIPILGKPAAFISETFGVNQGMMEFMTAKRGLEATAIEQLVRGVPSNFDALRIIRTLPQEGISPATNKIRIKRLKAIFEDVILNSIQYNVETGKRVPANLIILARELGVVREVDQIIRTGVNEEKRKYLDGISAGLEGFTKEGYIKEFGDPFKRSIGLVDKTDDELGGTISEAQQKELDAYEEKYLGKGK